MPTKRAQEPDRDRETELLRLFTTIAERNLTKVLRLLAESPALAQRAAEIGATRQDPHTYYFASIEHYAYAGDTPLHIAAAAHATDIARELVSKAANVRARNRRGAEPLHYAADGMPGSSRWDPDAQAQLIGLLIAHGADPDAKDTSGVTPLHRAVRTRSASAVRALLDNGANPLMKNESGSTPLHLAVQNTGRSSTGSAVARTQQAEIIRDLIARGARASDKDARGKSVSACAKAEWIRALSHDAGGRAP